MSLEKKIAERRDSDKKVEAQQWFQNLFSKTIMSVNSIQSTTKPQE